MGIDASIGIIGGNGWMGSAIAQAAIDGGVVDPRRLILSGRSGNRGTEIPGARWARDNAELVARSGIIVVSVRPDQFAGLDIDARGKLVVSVMAGVSVQAITAHTGAVEVVRAMPNAAAAIRRSFTPWFGAAPVSAANRSRVRALFDACGEAAEVPLESHIDYCAGMTGSGAAFPALLAEALVAHAVAQGLPQDFARRAALGVVAGASRLLARDGVDSADIVREMIDYDGTTAAALQAMLGHGFNEAVAAGLEAASARGQALSAQPGSPQNVVNT